MTNEWNVGALKKKRGTALFLLTIKFRISKCKYVTLHTSSVI
jgi:hypothetical protein